MIPSPPLGSVRRTTILKLVERLEEVHPFPEPIYDRASFEPNG